MFDALVMVVGALDSLPNMGRLVLGAALLACLLGLIDRRIPPSNVALGVSYRKTALLALVVVPVLIHLVIGIRLVLLVEELPALGSAPGYLWWLVLAAWLVGAIYVGATYAGSNWLGKGSEVIPAGAVQEVDDKLAGRFRHWCNRLNIASSARLGTGNVQVPATTGVFDSVIVLPSAVLHWPAVAQDLLMVRELCYLKRKTRIWSVVGGLIAALYWPLPWVRTIADGLNGSLMESGNRLAMSCFNDRLGYERAAKQLEQRLQAPAGAMRMPKWEEEEQPAFITRTRYQTKSARKDPQYDRVFWSLVQATVVMFILTGMTLRQLEEFEAQDVDLSERWFFSYERSDDYSDKDVESTRARRW